MGHTEAYEMKSNARIRLMAFAFNHDSEVLSCDARRPISLVNVHHAGARLRKQHGVHYCGLGVGDNVVLDLRLVGETANLQATVTWADGDDVYVDFGSPLAVGVSDLQSAMSN